MSVKIAIDSREFQKALHKYKEATGKSNAEIVNRAAMNIAFRSAQYTPKASRSSITGMLDQFHAGSVYVGKSGNRLKKAKKLFRATPRARGFVLWWLKTNGKNATGITDEQVLALVKKIRGRRLASIAFIKSGWLPAARAFQAAVKGASGFKQSAFGREKVGIGGSKIARVGLFSTAELWNASINKDNKSSEAALHKYGKPGFDRAVQFVSRDMLSYARRKLRENKLAVGLR